MPTAWEIQGPWWVLGNFEIVDVSLSKFCDTQHLQIFGEGVGPRRGMCRVVAHVITLFLPPAQCQS